MNKKGFSLIELLIVVVIIGIIVIIAVPSLLESKKAAQVNAAMATLRNISSSQASYASKPTNKQSYGDYTNLVAQKFIDDRFTNNNANYDGYTFAISRSGTNNFTATAAPDDTENPTFTIREDGVLRYSNGTAVGS